MRDRFDAPALCVLLAGVGWLHRAALRLPLRNADDWFHVDVAAGLLALDPAAWARAISGYGASDTLRGTPWLLWMADFGLFGFEGAGYYATNLGLHLAIVAGTYALVRRLGGGVGGGVLAGALVGLNIGTGQGTYYLAARDDQLGTVIALALVLLWPWLRGSRRGIAAAVLLYGAACLCKPPLVVALGLLWLVDGGHSRRRTWLPFVALAGAYGAALLWLLGPGGRLLGEGAAWYAAPQQALTTLVAPGWALGVPSRSLGQELWVWLLIALLAGTTLVRSRAAWGLGRVGLGWLALTLPLPLFYLAGRSAEFNDSGRQMLLPSVGLALLAGAALPAHGAARRVGIWAGALLALLLGFSFSQVGPHFLERREPTVERFVAALRGHEGPPVVALQRPNQALSSLLISGALPRLAGGQATTVLLQGGDRAWATVPEPYGYGRLVEVPWPEGPVLAEVFGDPGQPPSPWPSYRSWTPPRREPGEPAQTWDFSRGAGGWGPWPPADRGHLGLPRWVAGEGFVVDASIRMPEGEVAAQLALPDKPGILLSPPLEIATASVCGLELDLGVDAVRPLRGRGVRLLPEGRFVVLTWSERADRRDGWRGVVVAPIAPDGSVSVRLDRSLPWTEVEVVRRLGLLASNAPGRVVIRGLGLRWCR